MSSKIFVGGICLPARGRAHRRAPKRACLGKPPFAAFVAAPGRYFTGTTEHKHYVSAGGVTFAPFTSRIGTASNTTRSYFHHDHLGSIAVVTDELGAVTERLAYDPWGKRRFVNSTPGAPDTLDAVVGQKTDRGFMMHEHLDEIGIIHMNGRVYDPLIGRFMSADPMVEFPSFLQSYNRYAYAINNPLRYTDPSGFCFFCDVFRAAVIVAVAVFVPELITTMIAESAGAAAAAGLSGASAAAAYGIASAGALGAGSTAIIAGAVGGFAVGALSSRSIEGGLQGALTGGLFGLASGLGSAASVERYVAHAVAGCASSAAGGGGCEQGAASAVFGKFTTNGIGESTALSGPIAKGVASAVAGGVGSAIAGGKFENGAVTAAYGYLFNEASKNGWDLKRILQVKDALNVREIYDEAVKRGEADRQYKIDEIRKIDERVEKTPDSEVT